MSKRTSRVHEPPRRMNRRTFLAASAIGLGGSSLLSSACKSDTQPAPTPAGSGSAASVLGASQPEVTDVRFGIIALTDCSPIVVAHEKGLFKKYGINSTIVKQASWAAVRD